MGAPTTITDEPETRPPLTARVVRFFGHGGLVAYGLIGGMLVFTALSTLLFGQVARRRLHRDVARLVLEDRSDLLDGVQWALDATREAVRQAQESAVLPDQPYLVVSTEERRLWYKKGDDVLFTTQVATGSGKTLVREGGDGEVWRFETPRGKLSVISKEEDPVWAPPDWHYVEQARKRRVGLVRLERGQALRASDGSVITVSGDEVVKRGPDGGETVLEATDGREIIVDGQVIMPPLGTSQRRYEGVLGKHRLNLGNGYALHGTNRPETIGQAVSHGCIRLLNEDIAKLYDMVRTGTPVYIY